MTEIKDLVLQKPRFNALVKQLRTLAARRAKAEATTAVAPQVIHLKGLQGSAGATFLAPIKNAVGRIFLFVLNDEEAAGYFYHDLCQIGGEEGVAFFPSGYRRSIKYGQVDSANEILRTDVVGRVAAHGRGAADVAPGQDDGKADASPSGLLIVTYPEALAEKVARQEELQGQLIRLERGQRIESRTVTEALNGLGFQRVDYVYEPGQYAMRGSILDVFSYSNEYPFRIDFFGNEIDSLRVFEVDTQLSRSQLDELTIAPSLAQSEVKGISLPEFLPDGAVVVAEDVAWVAERVRHVCRQDLSEQLIQSEEGDRNALYKLVDDEVFASRLMAFDRIDIGAHPSTEGASTIEFHTTLQPEWHKNFDLVAQTMQHYRSEGYTLHILSDSPKQLDRIEQIFEDRGDTFRLVRIPRAIHAGFIDDDTKNCYFTDHQIFDRYHKYNLRSERARSGKIAMSLKEIQEFRLGDYIVHVDHGVGQFGGLVQMPIGAPGPDGKIRTQEVVKLIYKNNDQLYVSIHALDKLSKYRSRDTQPPQLSRLGSGAWEKMRDRTKAKMKDMARELILLYAKRREEPGFQYSPDTNMQHELEASFIYEDTPDQLKATVDVKHDMESSRPMDRLICGDVGFGKTEIAVRAALKACADCKQVAVLVPTTVLAFQHYKTFSERLKDFPVRVDYLSRARSGRQTNQILTDLATGEINIIVGTHKLISKSVRFADLGLLIIDEEQKFGVRTKDALKRMRVNVDTLTMTATPIPRTLQFSLMGARDLSIIATPPPNRHPIQTEVHRDDDDLVREAINFELSRNGQVFYIHNKVSQLPDIVNRIRRLVPDARVAFAHGKMEPEIVEQLILDFANHEYDVLVCTTIVEAGLDIPNANTMIVASAQNFGLSELHQLRGRVGRTNKKAFCYLLSPPLATLSSDARRRLQAIENFSGLGSGIHLAMQDLDIRGAGNLLGGEQSGFIADLGYEAYQKVLRDAVRELKTQEFAHLYADEAAQADDTADFTDMQVTTQAERYKESERDQKQREGDARAAARAAAKEGRQISMTGQIFVADCNLDTDLDLHFPPDYVPDSGERIALYQELDNITRPQDIDAYCRRLIDRFGAIPPEGEELIRVVALRRMGRQLGFERLVLKQNQMRCFFPSDPTASNLYFQSETFGRVLEFYGRSVKVCRLEEKNGKRSLVFNSIRSVKEACDWFSKIINGPKRTTSDAKEQAKAG